MKTLCKHLEHCMLSLWYEENLEFYLDDIKHSTSLCISITVWSSVKTWSNSNLSDGKPERLNSNQFPLKFSHLAYISGRERYTEQLILVGATHDSLFTRTQCNARNLLVASRCGVRTLLVGGNFDLFGFLVHFLLFCLLEDVDGSKARRTNKSYGELI